MHTNAHTGRFCPTLPCGQVWASQYGGRPIRPHRDPDVRNFV